MNIVSILLVCLSQTPVGPLDAFRANLAATKVDIKFVFTGGFVSADVVDRLRSWTPDGVTFPEKQETTITGRWTCDGAAEMLTCRHPALTPALSPRRDGLANQEIPSKALPAPSSDGFQVLCNGDVQAEHRLGAPDIQIHLGDTPGLILLGRGPFCWWGSYRFPATLKSDHGDQAPIVHRATLSGYNVVVESYQIDLKNNDAWVRIDINYDPSVGYLPRYVRALGIANGSGVCRELYLIAVRPCAAGGFVPTEFYEATFSIAHPKHIGADEFDGQFPPPPRGRISLGHFVATDFKDLKGPAALEDLKGVNTVVARGGAIPLVSKAPLTADRIKSMLGRKLTDPRPSQMANLDISELNEFTRKPRHGWVWALLITATVVLAVLTVRWRKERAHILSLLAVLSGFGSLSGCTPSREPDARLSATVDRPRIIYDPEQTNVPLRLIVRNAGNVPIKIFHADGGCACRGVDQSGFPKALSPGATMSVGLGLSTPPSREEERFLVRFQTDHGDIQAPVSLVVLARDSFNPEALGSPTLNEAEGWEFDIVHRAVLDTEHPRRIPV